MLEESPQSGFNIKFYECRASSVTAVLTPVVGIPYGGNITFRPWEIFFLKTHLSCLLFHLLLTKNSSLRQLFFGLY